MEQELVQREKTANSSKLSASDDAYHPGRKGSRGKIGAKRGGASSGLREIAKQANEQ